MTVLVRAAVLAAALAGAVWLGLGLRSAELQRDAFAVATAAEPPPARVTAGLRAVRAARRAVPDGGPVSVEAGLLLNAGRREDAVAALERLVRLEPRNPVMWLLLSRGPVSAERRAEAEAVARRMAPPVPR